MIRARRACGASRAALALVFVSACSSPTPPAAGTDAAAAHPEQALIDDLVIANRILARQLGILDTRGHTSARSRLNPNRYFMPRYLSPGAITADDVVENDLDSNPVHGPRDDQAREVYLHGEIYKARPDVMAIVHSHTPEFVAYAMSSVPLWYGEHRMPVWDIRPFNGGRPGIVSAPELGRAMAQALGEREAVLLWGHGVAVTAGSLAAVVSRADDLRDAAQLQQAVRAMGATWNAQAPRAPAPGASDIEHTWAYWKQRVINDAGGEIPAAQPPAPARPADPDEGAMQDLVYANRILASDYVGVADGFGHVSVRSPGDANAYFIARGAVPGAVSHSHLERRSVADPDDGHGLSVHAEIYKTRPDVMAIVVGRAPELTALSDASVRLRPVVNGGSFLERGFPVLDLARFSPQPVLTSPALGRAVAEALGRSPGVLLPGHGFVLTDSTLYSLMYSAYALRQNAKIQQQAIALGGTVAHLDDVRVPPPPPAPGQPPPAQLGPPEGRDWVYWTANVPLD